MLDVLLGIGVIAALGYAIAERVPRAARLPAADWREVQGGTPLATSTGNGPVMVEFVDYQCPFCARAESEVFEALRDSLPSLRRVVRHFPIPSHPHAVAAAAAAECAGRQTGSIDRMHRLLYQVQDSLGIVSWTVLARRAGVSDTAAFTACTRSPAVLARIEADRQLGQRLAVHGTPTFFLDRVMVPEGTPAQLRAYLREKVAR